MWFLYICGLYVCTCYGILLSLKRRVVCNATRWTKLEGIMAGEIRQSQKSKIHYNSIKVLRVVKFIETESP